MPPPGGESLKDTVARALPYYCQHILPAVLRGERVLVAAHGNSLRALVMVLDRLTPKTIPSMELATGVPLVYRLKADFDGRVEGRAGELRRPYPLVMTGLDPVIQAPLRRAPRSLSLFAKSLDGRVKPGHDGKRC